MNELLQKYGCSNVFYVPEGLKELMADISREVLRMQPKKINEFIANYLAALLITREHGIMSVKILEDLCDCQPTVSEHLLQVGLERADAEALALIIKTEIESSDVKGDGKGTLKECQLLKKVLGRKPMDEDLTAKVCEVARNAYKDYSYRKDILKQGLRKQAEEPWEIAAKNTLNLYKKTKPTLTELQRATIKIQAAYRGYHVRREVLRHLLPKKDKKAGRKVDLSGPPLDLDDAREIDLGPVINIRKTVTEDNVDEMFDKQAAEGLGLTFDPTKTLTHVDDDFLQDKKKGVKLAESFTLMSSKSKSGHVPDTPDHSSILHDDSARPGASTGGPPPPGEHSAQRISFSLSAPQIIGEMKATKEGAITEVSEIPEDLNTTVDSENVDSTADQEVPEDLQGTEGTTLTTMTITDSVTEDVTDVEDDVVDATDGDAADTEGTEN